MTSKRKQIIDAIATNGLSTMDDLGFTTGIVRKSLHDNVKAACKDGLLERTMDDITNQPAYLLTAKGKTWHKNNISEQPQPTDKACCNAAAVVAKTAGGMVGELQKRCTEQEEMIADLQGMLKNSENSLESVLSVCRNFCSTVGNLLILPCTKYPLNLHECSVELESYISMLQANIGSLQAENMALKTLNEAMPGFGAEFATKYAVLHDAEDLYDTPEEAANHVDEAAIGEEIHQLKIIAIKPVGRVEIKAVFVPNKEAA